MERVKSLPCSVCDAPPPCDAHHIHQGHHFTTVALCRDCHFGLLGPLWKVRKLDELGALNITLARLAA